VNIWMPVYPVAPDNAMLFYPSWHGGGVPNNSDRYNYYEFNAWRGKIKEQSGGVDTRVHPAPASGFDLGPTLTVLPPVGGLMMFSADQLHASIPNRSLLARYSIDFRVVNRLDVEAHRGSACADVACEGTALRDFMRVSDLERLPEHLVAEYDTLGALDKGIALFEPDLR
jgi:ectoine hydroxylase-related dioxygenase (phytanoyl-CoA dioxygenase family)